MTDTDVRIALPLPFDVAGTLMQLVGRAWDDVQIVQDEDSWRHPNHMVLRIPETARPRALTDEQCAPIARDEHDVDVTEISPNGVALGGGTVKDVADWCWAIMHNALESNPDAANYLEHEIQVTVHGPERTDPDYVLIFARSSAQTPHRLRTRAEQDARTAQDTHDTLLRTVRAHLARGLRGLETPERVWTDLEEATAYARAFRPVDGD